MITRWLAFTLLLRPANGLAKGGFAATKPKKKGKEGSLEPDEETGEILEELGRRLFTFELCCASALHRVCTDVNEELERIVAESTAP